VVISLLDPKDCDPPHRVTHPEKLNWLISELTVKGWKGRVLIGYKLDGRVQLISGSHRYEAAKRLSLKLPVLLYPYDYITAIYGTDEWLFLVRQEIEAA
jgi:ParB-like chromosome segregation protein Spo0J